LEIGVGTGKNFDFYPANAQITAIDFSPAMLKLATEKAQRNNVAVALNLMDVESLCYADNCFDTVVASFVFCSVPHPRKGLKELQRVCKPGGKVILLEHVLSSRPPMAWLMNCFNPLVVNAVGANINRQTLKNVQGCGFSKVYVDSMSGDIVKLIEAVK
jgi:ubiquinone/menaquinone biosynthesis C-methylase UbiE